MQFNTYFYLHREREECFFIGGQRLVWAKRTNGSKFTVTEAPLYGTANLFFVKTERINLKYLAALLNSKLMYFYMHQRLKHTGDLLQIDKNQFMKISIYVPEFPKVKAIEQKVDVILEAKNIGREVSQFENELDEMVYALYDLSSEEIAIIDPSRDLNVAH